MLGLRAHDFAGRDCGAIQGFLGAMRLLGFRATLAACRNHISICEEYQNGDPGRTRTLNLLIRSQLLYPVELPDRLRNALPACAMKIKGKSQGDVSFS